VFQALETWPSPRGRVWEKKLRGALSSLGIVSECVMERGNSKDYFPVKPAESYHRNLLSFANIWSEQGDSRLLPIIPWTK
jgi:hypothetical protein